MVDLFRCVGGSQLAFGIISLMSGIFAFFPVASYKPWYIGWSTKISAPVWTGLLAIIAGTCALVANKEQKKKSMWELCYTFSIFCTVACPMHFAVAVVSIMLGPYCYYSFFGGVGTEYLGYAVVFPFPYLRFPGLCLDPLHYEGYHLTLQAADLLCSTAIFILSLTVVITLTLRLLRSGHVNKI
ncbi:transmembrane protein 212-like [Conger conger]|uniref:transmembrane protein 212-like n=1 Tax=Conger conger TaxID=82655 RepID=UPI002A59C5C8|nr:transmembrane protein 212-like [Conger conger]